MAARQRSHSGHHILQITLIPSPNNGGCGVGELTDDYSTPRFQHPIHFADGHLGLADVSQTKTDGHRIKTGGRERQRFRVAFNKLDIRVTFPTFGHHAGRKVEGDHRCTGSLQRFGGRSGSGGHVKNPFPGFQIKSSNGGDPPQQRVTPGEKRIGSVIPFGDLVEHAGDLFGLFAQVGRGHSSRVLGQSGEKPGEFASRHVPIQAY